MHDRKSPATVRGFLFPNGAVAAAMSYAFGELAAGRGRISGSVLVEDAQKITIEAARAKFEAVIDALSVAGVDVSNIYFDEGYGYTLYGEVSSTNEIGSSRFCVG
jgi:hypothetical protein